MKKLFLFFALSLLTLATVGAQTQQGGAAPKQRLVGEVTAVDASARQVTVRSDTGESVTVSVGDQTTYTRMPPGETNLQKGEAAAFADVRVGDRVLAPGISAAGGTASRIILMARAGVAGGQQRDDGRRLGGRVVSTDPSKKLIVVQARSREGAEPSVTIDASGDVRFMRLAPDSQRPADAQPGSFADIKPGDSVRATGTRGADGGPFKAEEVISGAATRFIGTVSSVDASRGTLTVKNELTGQNMTLTFGARSTLRRVTPEFEQEVARQRAEFAQRREQRQQRRAAGEGGQAQGEGGRERSRGDGERRRGDGERRGGDGERRGPGGGPGRGNFQQMFDSLPAVTLAELKKGDAVVVTATPSTDASRATVVTLVTGAAEFLRGMQQFQGGGQRGMSPGLPGDVLGGGQGGTREPPR
jgi:hypothetical protein